jgi:photosynthetic reaction center cytochrome c subunit
MKSSNKKTFSVISFLIAGVIISVAATKPGTPTITEKSSASDTGFFKNLQVLPKDISKDSLGKIMDGFKAALGVKCGFCHAFDTTTKKMDFASDKKEEKGIARYMMKMTAEINSTYFNFEKSQRADTITTIKCKTCHRGSPHPDEAAMSNDSSNEHHDMQQQPPSPQGDSSKPKNQ